MHCNQPFCGNTGFNNAQCFGYNICNTPPINSGFYPEIVGEGDVNCITLPDGTCQYFFTPTAKWCSPNIYNAFNMVNTNQNNPYANPYIGTWFVKSITNPIVPHPCLNNCSYPRCELSRPVQSSDCNMNPINTGFQLKFHSDRWTSTTDIHYFYPYVRQYDCTFTLPKKGCAAVQVDTPTVNNTTCHYEVLCPNPCHCSTKPTCINAPVSAMSLDTKNKSTEAVICECDMPQYLGTTDKLKAQQKLQLLPSDRSKKRIKLESKTQKIINSKSKDVICECDPPPTSDKSIETCHTCDDSGLDSNSQSPSCCGQEIPIIKAGALLNSYIAEAETWHPSTNTSKNVFQDDRNAPGVDYVAGCSCSGYRN